MATLAFVLDTFGANLILHPQCVSITCQGETYYFQDDAVHTNYKMLEEFFCSRYPAVLRPEPEHAYSILDNFANEQEATSIQVNAYYVAEIIDDLIGCRYEGIRADMSITQFFRNEQETPALVGCTGLVFQDEIAARKFYVTGKSFLPEDAYLHPGSKVISFSVSVTIEILDFIASTQSVSPPVSVIPAVFLRWYEIKQKIRTIFGGEQRGNEDKPIYKEGDISEFRDIETAIENFNFCWDKSYRAVDCCRLTGNGTDAIGHVGRKALNQVWRDLPDSAPVDIFISEAAELIKKKYNNQDRLKQNNGFYGAVSMIIRRKEQLIYQNGHLTKKNNGL